MLVMAKINIILIEDDSVLAEMYVQKFTREGFGISHALDGDEGIKLIRAKRPDLVLLDIMMPKKSGIEVLQELRDAPETKDVAVVLLSNVGDQEYIDKGMALGASGYLLKSNYTPSEVVDKIRGILAEQKS
jgi:two-component system, OmpR family, alkaline phosphatase synthesis response regulator PhoP